MPIQRSVSAVFLVTILASCTASAGDVSDSRLEDLLARMDATTTRLDQVAARLEAIEQKDPPTPSDAPDLAGRIACRDGRCTVERRLFDEMLERPEWLSRQARVVPAVQGGSTHGFKLFGLRPESIPGILGFRNGDTVTAMNGTPLTSIEAAMSGPGGLEGAETVVIDFVRDDARQKLAVEIR